MVLMGVSGCLPAHLLKRIRKGNRFTERKKDIEDHKSHKYLERIERYGRLPAAERGYCDAGGALPEDWLRTARLLDATRQVATMNEERELPVVFAECCELIEAVVTEGL
jgi:hypothetical protein